MEKTTYCISGFLNKKIITPPVANVEKSTEPDLFGFRQLSSQKSNMLQIRTLQNYAYRKTGTISYMDGN